MEVTVTPLTNINFAPGTEREEIIQNVRCIMATMKGTVPLDREFGLDFEGLDTPMPTAQMLFRMHLIDAISRYEPRVQVRSITFTTADNTSATAANGELVPHVTMEILSNA